MLRSHNCGELRKTDKGKTVTLCGWVNKVRTHGNVTFIDLRDRYGITQLVAGKDVGAEKLGHEFVIKVTGEVCEKPEPNKNLITGDIEVSCSKLEILNTSETVPLDMAENTTATEDTRLTYRYV